MTLGRWHAVLGPGLILWSWSVRPDIWGPGWHVRVPSRAMLLARTSIHEYNVRQVLDCLVPGQPGEAEALAATGLVIADQHNPGLDPTAWVDGWP